MFKNFYVKSYFIAAMLCLMVFVSSCSDEVDTGNRYTFTGETIADYLENRDAEYASMIQILRQAGMFGVLSTYGSYTFFLPTNDAVQRYLIEQDSIYHATKDTEKPVRTGIDSPNLDDLSDSMALVISQTHLIPYSYNMADLREGVIPSRNYRDRYLGVSFKVVNDDYFIMVNNQAAILNGDNELENGVLHVVDAVVSPSTNMLPSQLAKYDYFSLFSLALMETGFEDSLQLWKDESYELGLTYALGFNNVEGGARYPHTKYLKYTGFIETNEVFASEGIYTLDDLKVFAKKWYGTAEEHNYRSPKNALFKFIAYHFLNCEVPYNKLVHYNLDQHGYKDAVGMVSGIDRFDYFETMYGTLVKTTRPLSSSDPAKSGNLWLNYSKRDMPFNLDMRKFLNIKVLEISQFSELKEEYVGFDQNAMNGTIHPIDKILVYNENEMAGNVLNERMRFDIGTLLPELMTNGVRYCPWNQAGTKSGNGDFVVPLGYCRNYVSYSDNSSLHYLCPYSWGCNYLGDEMICIRDFDFAYRLPPVPSGTYEIRIGYTATSIRSITQFYVDGKVTGIPVDLRIAATNAIIGWVADNETEDEGVENDKVMRNHGYMKAPASYVLYAGQVNARAYAGAIRKIVTTKHLGAGDHWMRFKKVDEAQGAEFNHDYIEMVPTGVVNNISNPEDRI